MRTLNVRRAIVLFVVTIVIVGSTGLLHSYQLNRHAKKIKQQAEAAWNDNPRRAADAIQAIRSYLVLKPQDYEARETLGCWCFDTAQFPAAMQIMEELVRVLEHQTPRDEEEKAVIRKARLEARRKAADAAFRLERYLDAKTHLELLKNELPDDADLLVMLGKCQDRMKEEEEAVKSFTPAIKQKPDWVEVYIRKANALLSLNKRAEADQCMAEMIAYWEKPGLDPPKDKAAYAHFAYGLYLKQRGGWADALKQAETTLKLKKDHAGALLLAAESEMNLRHYPKAHDYAEKAIEAAPQAASVYAIMKEICLTRDDQSEKTAQDKQNEAIEVLQTGIKTCPSKEAKAELLWHLATIHLDRAGGTDAKSLAEAEDCVKKLRDYGFSPTILAFLDARIAYAHEDWKSARERFEKVRPQLNDIPESHELQKFLDYWTGYCYLQQGNDDKAVASFRSSLTYDKFYFRAHDRIAQILLAQAEGKLTPREKEAAYKEAVAEYQQVLAGNPADAEARLALAQALVRWNRDRKPEDQNWSEVELALRPLLSPHDPAWYDGPTQLLVAEALAAQGKADDAADLVERLRDQGSAFWIAQVNLAAQRGDMDHARKFLGEAKAKLGNKVPIRLAEAGLLLREQGLEAGAEIEKLATESISGFSPAEKAQLWEGLMNYLQAIKDFDRAKQLCRQIANLKPNDAMIRYRLFELAFWAQDARDMAGSLRMLDSVLDEIDKIAGRGPLWLYCKAVRLELEASQGKPELLNEAMNYATQAQELRKSWSWPHVLQGEICRKQGHDDEALQHYLQAVSTGERNPHLISQLLQILYERQRFRDADQVILQLESNHTPLTPEIAGKEQEILAFQGDFNRALESANKYYDSNSNDYLDHVKHGRVLAVLTRRAKLEGHQDKLPEIKEQAEHAFRRACQSAPNSPECRVELVQLLVATDQMGKARIAAKDAEEMIPPNASPLAMGYIHEALGQTQEAGQCYEKAFSLNPDVPLVNRQLADFYLRSKNPQRAAPLIERLLGGTLQTSESDLVAARRLKAVLLSNEGYPKLKEANDLIDRNLKSPQASRQDKLLKVRFLMADPYLAHGPEVLKRLEDLVATDGAEPDPDDRFKLASLYLARDDWAHCREQMGKLVNGDRANPRYLAAYVRMLLDKNELVDAEQWLERLDPDSKTAESIALRADYMFRDKRWAAVPDFLAAYVNAEKIEPKEQLDRILIVARLLEDFGSRLTGPGQREQTQKFLEKARERYESYVEKRPGSEMLLAGFHARCGKVDEAIERIERNGEKSPSQEVLEVIGAIVSRPETENMSSQREKQLEKLEAVVVALLAKTQRPTPLLIGLAELQTSMDRLEDAEKIYREILGKDPNDDLAANNLSMILALQKTKLDEALELIDKAIERQGPLGSFLDTRAVVLIARHEPQRALEDLDAALAEKSTPVRRFHHGWAFQEDGNTVKAKEDLRLARRVGLQDSMLSKPEREIRREIDRQGN